jgi:hypothetical protein
MQRMKDLTPEQQKALKCHTLLSNDEICREFLAALGIDTSKTFAVTLRFKTSEPVRVTVESWAKSGERLEPTFHEYELKRKEPPLPSEAPMFGRLGK